jgi:DNA invertase Pin-like site-specific DNA recombinase
MPSWAEVLSNGAISRQKALGMARRFKPLHTTLASACRTMRVLAPVIEVAALTVFDPRQYLALGCAITFELIRNDDPWHIRQALEELPEELLRGPLVTPTLHQDIEDIVVLIHRSPEVVPFAINCQKDLIIVAYEASRLARNNTDWYTLLDIATVVGTLIADTEGVYDPCQYNDRLLLGLRGLLSEAELHVLRLRMDAGRQRQITQGTYRQNLPTGLVRLESGQVVKDPDGQIQRTLELVFARFATLGSCHKVLRSLRDDGILLPRRQQAGLYAGQVRWRKPTQAVLSDMLHNPAYAGAFVYGRRGLHPQRRPGQRRRVQRPIAEWPTMHHAVYPAYMSWEQFLANQARLADHASTFARRARGAPRQGQALLAGFVVCGRCGYQMRVVYKPQPRYACRALAASHGVATCLQADGAKVDAAVVEAFFAALAPAELA